MGEGKSRPYNCYNDITELLADVGAIPCGCLGYSGIENDEPAPSIALMSLGLQKKASRFYWLRISTIALCLVPAPVPIFHRVGVTLIQCIT